MDHDHPKNFGKFEKLIYPGITLVGFESPWSNPCLDQKRVIEALAGQFKERVHFVELNIDDNRQFAINLGITSIPTLIIFKDGKESRRLVGLQQADILIRALEDALS